MYFVFINCHTYDKMNDNSVAMEIIFLVLDIVNLIDTYYFIEHLKHCNITHEQASLYLDFDIT